MKQLRVLVLAVCAAALAGCTRAPADDALKADVQALLENDFAPGLVEVDTARRANDFPFVRWGEEVRVRYEATLVLKREHRFGAWDQINIGAMAQLLDAAPQDIAGVKAGGNAAGDRLTVRGRFAYRVVDGTLTPGNRREAGPPDAAEEFVLLADLKESANQVWNTLARSLRGTKLGLAREEWIFARRSLAARTARLNGGVSVATDREETTTWRLGAAAERAAPSVGFIFANIDAAGPHEALDFLRSGRVSAAVLRNTDAALAAAALAPYADDGPYRLTALAALFPEPVHIVVRADSALGSPADLFGKHVAVAGTARVDAMEAEAVLRAHAVPLAALAAPLMAVSAEDALDQLAAGAFDALVMTSPLPNAPLRAAAQTHGIRLLPFDSDAIAFLTSGAAHYVAITIPARTYPGQTRPLAAVAPVAMLVSVETVPPQEVGALLDFMLSRVDYPAGGSLAGAMVNRRDAQRPMTLPWHSGAAAYYETLAKQ